MKVSRRTTRHKASEREEENMQREASVKTIYYTTAEEIERANVEGGEPRYFEKEIVVWTSRKEQLKRGRQRREVEGIILQGPNETPKPKRMCRFEDSGVVFDPDEPEEYIKQLIEDRKEMREGSKRDAEEPTESLLA